MNRCVYQQNAMSVCEEISASALNALVCPKPRRIGTPNGQIRPHRYLTSHQMKSADCEAGSELFDFLLPKGSFGTGISMASSPPFFYGSPPSRTSNPLSQDTRFVNNMYSSSPLSPTPMMTTSPSSCGRMNFVHKPAAKRVEGFDCLNRDRDNCSISAVA